MPDKQKDSVVVELLPCPFCGSEGSYGECFAVKPVTYFVNCTECLASTNQLSPCMGLPQAEAAAAWNRRASPSHPQEKDAGRLLWLVQDVGIDAIGDMDLHEGASHLASKAGHDEPDDADLLQAVRDAIDRAIKEGEGR